MQINTLKTPIIGVGENLYAILDQYLPKLEENEIIVITSKIVSLCQGRVVKITDGVDKRELIHREAELYLEDPHYFDKYHISLTIKNNLLIVSSGIDESNGNGYYVLWPDKLQETTNAVWEHLRTKHNLKNLGVIITDSHTTPLRWGVTGVGLSFCGFQPLNKYIGKPDLFGRKFKFVNASVWDGLAAAAVLAMGEGAEQTPLAVIKNLDFVQFEDHVPTKEELQAHKINLEDDIYAPLLTRVSWQKGGTNE